jgi:hypothetical protein
VRFYFRRAARTSAASTCPVRVPVAWVRAAWRVRHGTPRAAWPVGVICPEVLRRGGCWADSNPEPSLAKPRALLKAVLTSLVGLEPFARLSAMHPRLTGVVRMDEHVDIDRDVARRAGDEQITLLIHDSRDDVLLGLIENPRFDDRHAVVLLRRLELSASILEAVARWAEGRGRSQVRRALAFHPHIPQTLGFRLVRELGPSDLVPLMLSPSTAPALRHLAEELILARVSYLPTAQKITLARRGAARIVGALLVDGHADVLPLVLDAPTMNEGQVLKALGRPVLPAPVVVAIAQHGRWSHVYAVRLGLLRQPHVPLAAVMEFLPGISTSDLRVLSQTSSIPSHVRPHLRRELANRSLGGVGRDGRNSRPRSR